jgi:hypothetical protein
MQWNSKQAHPSRFGLDERRCETSLAEISVAAPLEAANYTQVVIILRSSQERCPMLRKTLLLLVVCAGNAVADSGLDAVKALGHLNGEALACKQMALVDRIRTRIVNEAPKTREVGEAFEAATTERFLAMGTDLATCTDARTLAERIDRATENMRAAFVPAPGRKE